MESVATLVASTSGSGSGLPPAADDPEIYLRPRSALLTITVLLPLFYNRNALGIRYPVGIKKISHTIDEMKRQFSGFSLSLYAGWCREDRVWDLHLRAKIDIEMEQDMRLELLGWKALLEDRFRQRSIYMCASAPILWL